METTLVFETSTASSQIKRPHIRKGFYAGELLEIKPAKDADGNWRENKYGHQIILEFGVYRLDEDGNITKPATITEGNITQDVILSNWLNTDYKSTEKGTNKPILDATGKPIYRSAFTPKSRATSVFQALGWQGPEEGKKLNVKDYLGKWVELTVDDVEEKDETGKPNGKYFSGIKDIKAYKGRVPDGLQHIKKPERAPTTTPLAQEEDIIEDPAVAERIQQLRKMLESGDLTQKGFDTAVAHLRQGK